MARRIAEGLPVGSRHARPTLHDDLRQVWNAFGLLSGRRQRGPHGVQPLASVELAIAAGFLGGRDEETCREWFVILAALDDEFMRFADETARAERDRRRAK